MGWPRKPLLGDLALAGRVIQETLRGYAWTDPAIVGEAAEVERRHVAEQRRRAYRHQRRTREARSDDRD